MLKDEIAEFVYKKVMRHAMTSVTSLIYPYEKNMDLTLRIFLILIGLFSFNINTLLGQQIYVNQEYYEIKKDNKEVRPKSKFKFRKKRHANKIDTNAIYLTMYSDSSFAFIRFFKDTVFESGLYKTKPNEQEIEDLNYGVWSCYTMTRKRLLIIETPKRFQMGSKWIYYYGNILTDKVEFTHYDMSYSGVGSYSVHFQKPLTSSKQPVDFKNRKYECKFTKPKERNQSVTLLRDCTGTYLRWQGKDYQVCNIEKVSSFPDGSTMTATFKSIKECNGSAKDEIVCAMLRINEGWIEVVRIK